MNNHIVRVTTRFLLLAILAVSMIAGDIAFAQEKKEALEEVTVTGSRIARRDYTSQSPIVTIKAETFEDRANIGLEATLNQMPQFNVAGNQASLSPASTPFPQATSAPGAATIDLRGIGTNRTLVLVDGRRAQPANGLLVVDLNTIPAAAIANIEVITGGAAAVYGADALAGVVNLKLKHDFEGLEFSGQYGTSEAGDGEETTISGLFGANTSSGRGNVMLGANYSKRSDILAKDREFRRKGWADPNTMAAGLGSSNLSQYDPARSSACSTYNFAVNPITMAPDCGQPITPNSPTIFPPKTAATWTIDQNGNIFDSNNPLSATNPYTGPLGDSSGFSFKINPDGTLGFNDQDHSYVQIPLERYAAFGSARYQLTDHINMFTDARYAETFTTAKGFTSGLFSVWSVTVPYNPAIDDPASPTFGAAGMGPRHPVPAGLATMLNSRPVPNAPWTYAGGLDYLGNFDTQTTSHVYQVIGGFNGDIPGREDWTWEVFGSHGKSYVNAYQPEGFPNLRRMQNLFNADMYGQDFDINTLPGFFPLAVTGHCTTGLPIFNADGSVNDTASVSKDCSDYAVLRMNDITALTQEVVEGNLQGGLFDLPAGQLKFAVGADYRQEHFVFQPDSGYNANQDFANVVQNIILPVAVDGSTDVKEIYAELAIPVIKDLPFVKSFEVDPGVRYSKYNTTGGTETYKFTADWEVNDWVRLRGGYQLATRSPNITELFTPKGGSSIDLNAPDACANIPGITQSWGNVAGNPNRKDVQVLCQYLMTREGAPSSLYDPNLPGTGNPASGSADDYRYNVFGGTFPFPFSIAVTGGNPDLTSETADTFTAGVVFQSPFEHPALQKASLSLDWYRIEIVNAIGTPTGASIYQQCFDPQFNSLIGSGSTGAAIAANNPFCALIHREYVGGAPLTPGNYGAPRKYDALYINQGGINTEGFDIQLDWGFDFADMGIEAIPGSFNVNIQATYLRLYEVSPFPGGDFTNYTGTDYLSSYFDYRTFSNFNYTNGPWSVGLRWQHLPSVDPVPGLAAGVQGAASHDQVDMFARWSISETWTLRAGIDNLLDAQPEVVGTTPVNANLGATDTNYDQIGRRFFFGVTANF